MQTAMEKDIFGCDGSLNLAAFSTMLHDESLEDGTNLEDVCNEIYRRCKNTDGNVELRVAGRVISDLHRQLRLSGPSDAELCQTFMPYTSGANTALSQNDFLTLLAEVYSKTSRDSSFVATKNEEDSATEELQPQGEITVHVYSMNGASASLTVDDDDVVKALQAAIEEKLSIPISSQQLVLGSRMLAKDKKMYLQGVKDNSTLTLVRTKPQATILRIRKANLGDTSIPQRASSKVHRSMKSEITSLDRADDAARSYAFQGHCVAPTGICEPNKNRCGEAGFVDQLPWKAIMYGERIKQHREPLPDVKIRRCKLGKL
jgi:hypothetical protein